MNPRKETLFYCFWVGLLLVLCGQRAFAVDQPGVPTLDAGLGPCRADFTVKDDSGKGIYNAQIDVTIKYGFMRLRNIELDGATDANGRARFTGLPNFPTKPLEFVVKSGAVSRTIIDDPSSNCAAAFSVSLPVR